jgi:hypothetical protein
MLQSVIADDDIAFKFLQQKKPATRPIWIYNHGTDIFPREQHGFIAHGVRIMLCGNSVWPIRSTSAVTSENDTGM